MAVPPEDNDRVSQQIIDSLLTKPPPGYVFLVMASQDSHYDLFMLTLIRRALELKLNTLDVVTEARNREIMGEMSQLQGDQFSILEVAYGQKPLGQHSCSPHLHEINITLRELRNVYGPRVIAFEGLTPLLIDFSARDVVHFFKECVEESIKVGSREFYLVHEHSADTVTMNQLFSLAHGIITLTTSKGKYYLTVRKSTGVDLPYSTIEYVPSMTNGKKMQWGIVLNW